MIAEATKRDDQLQMLKVISDVWPDRRADAPIEVLQFRDFRNELSTYNGVIYRGERTVIPLELRSSTLKTIHNTHGDVKV